MNNQPKQLTNEELRYLRHQLQDVRNRVNHLLDNLDCCGPMNVSNTADSFTDGNCPATAGGIAHSVSTSVSNATSSFDPLTEQKYSKDGTTTGSADTGEFSRMYYILQEFSEFRMTVSLSLSQV